MLKLLYVFCILSITSMCNGTHFQNMEMTSYSVKPMNSRQLEDLTHFRDTQNEYFFQGGSMKINKPLRVIFPRELDDAFLAKMQRINLNPQNELQKEMNLNARNEHYVDHNRNTIVKQQLRETECSKQLGEVCLEDDDCCDGRCKPLFPSSRSCQN